MLIDFKLYFYVRIHKNTERVIQMIEVVNWFQIVFLREDSQVNLLKQAKGISCELISNCIFTWGFTSIPNDIWRAVVLWIDFKLYFYVRIHKTKRTKVLLLQVVNWFQIVFLREDSQVGLCFSLSVLCCELISNCIFTWGFTRYFIPAESDNTLWIDFKLYFYVRIHKSMTYQDWKEHVVNWFQIVFLREDSQAKALHR